VSVAIPGSLTTAALVLRLAAPGVRTEEMAFDQIGDAVKDGQVAAGVIIHEGQVTWQEEGFHNVVDLGIWWQEQTGLPLPLGANVIKRDLGEKAMVLIADGIRKSVAYGLENRHEAVKYAQDYGRNLIQEKVDQFVGMYVNDFTLDWGRRGRLAVEELLLRGAEAGIVPKISSIDFVG
jgi:1,4-dihydroxy-6-naphthoate synthase